MVDIVDVVQYIIGKLVDDPGAVRITAEGDEVKVLVGKSDMGKVIGKQGRIAKAVRTLVHAVGAKYNKKYNVEIDEAQ